MFLRIIASYIKKIIRYTEYVCPKVFTIPCFIFFYCLETFPFFKQFINRKITAIVINIKERKWFVNVRKSESIEMPFL